MYFLFGETDVAGVETLKTTRVKTLKVARADLTIRQDAIFRYPSLYLNN